LRRSKAYRDIELLTVQIQDRISDCTDTELRKLQAELNRLTESDCWWTMFRLKGWLEIVIEMVRKSREEVKGK
jgi:hypothetical protein